MWHAEKSRMYNALPSYYKVNTVKLLSRSRNRALHQRMSQSSPPRHDLSQRVATVLINWSTPPCLIVLSPMYTSHGFSGGTSGKESACQYRRCKIYKFDPWVGKIPWNGNGNPLQYSCLENSTDRGAWRLRSMESQRVRHDWAHTHTASSSFILKQPRL